MSSFSLVVEHVMKHEYFVIDPDNVLGSGATAGSAPVQASAVLDSGGSKVWCVYQIQDIPVINKSQFYVAFGGTPDFSNITMSIVPAGGKTVGDTTWFPTMPDLVTYQSWGANAAANGWTSTVWNGADTTQTGVGQLVAIDSKKNDFTGLIVERVTTYILVR